MAALATTADYEAITDNEVTSDNNDRIERLLELASSAVLAGAHGQYIIQTENTDILVQPQEGVAFLPQRPVISITSVVADGVTLTAGTDYRHEPGGDGRPAKLIRRVNGRDASWTCELLVTYVSGWADPQWAVALVVAIVVGTVTNAGGQAPTQETAGPHSESFDPAEAQPASMALTPSAQAVVDRMCKVKGPASVPVAIGVP